MQSLISSPRRTSPGPALCAVLDGAVLSPTELAALLSTRAGGYRLRGGATGAGGGLAAAFSVTDVLQSLAGDACCFFDPSGEFLSLPRIMFDTHTHTHLHTPLTAACAAGHT